MNIGEFKVSIQRSDPDVSQALQAAAYLRAKSEIKGGPDGHFGLLGGKTIKAAVNTRMKEILSLVANDPEKQLQLLSNNLKDRAITSSAAMKFLQSHSNIGAAISSLRQTLDQRDPSRKEISDSLARLKIRLDSKIEKLHEIKTKLQGNSPMAKEYRRNPEMKAVIDGLCRQMEQFYNRAQINAGKVQDGLDKQDKFMQQTNSSLLTSSFEAIDRSLNCLIGAEKTLERAQVMQTNPAGIYEQARQHLDLRNKDPHAAGSEATVFNNHYPYNEVAQDMIKAAFIIAQKPSSKRTQDEQKVLHDMRHGSQNSKGSIRKN
jgi:hypothetical protein